MPNRIAAAIAAYQAKIDGGTIPQDKLDKLNTDLNMEFDEHFAGQNAQAEAHAGGKLTLEEAQTVYQALGQSADHFNKQPLATKIVVTQLVQELLSAKLGRRRQTA
jgi:hypothetical protein